MMAAEDRLAGRCNAIRGLAAVVLVLGCGTNGTAMAQAATYTPEPAQRQRTHAFKPTVSSQLLWTNNVALNEARLSDFVLTVTPQLSIEHQSDRALLRGSIAAPFVLHAKNEASDAVYPEVNLFGRAELVDQLFFIEARANVYTTYFNPFGARSQGLENVLVNRYTAQSYSVSPILEGRIGGNIRYLLRDDNNWSQLGDAPVSARNIYTNRLLGSIDRDPTPFGWGFDLQRTAYEFDEPTGTQTLALVRARGSWQPSGQLQLRVSGGYERNELLTKSEDVIYGAGFFWRPSDRTVVDANWEHRFFGASYRFLFEHRTRQASFSVNASRNISSYPEQIAALPANSFVPGILDVIFASRIPDPLARLQFIAQFMQDQGLPVFLSDAVSIFSRRLQLVEGANASMGLLGVRNTVLFSVYYRNTKPITGEGEEFVPILTSLDSNKQTGTTVSWSHQLSSLTALTLTGNASRTTANPPFDGTSDEWSVRLNVTRTLSPKTTVNAGARYQSFKSDLSRNFTEAAVFVGAAYSFE